MGTAVGLEEALARVRAYRAVNATVEGDLWAAVVAARAAGCSLRTLADAAGLSVTHLNRLLKEDETR